MKSTDRSALRESLVRSMTASNLTLALVLTVGLSIGCRSINKHLTEAVLDGGEAKQWHIYYGSTHRYGLSNDSLEQIAFEGTIAGPRISIRYQKGLADQAQQIADRTRKMLEQVEQRTGITLTTRSTIQLLRFDEPPQNFSIRLTVEPNEFPLPLFVRAGDESYAAILAQNRSYPYLFVHELVETSLVCGKAGGQVLPDVGWGALGLTAHVNNYTRWFRDGLANYAGFVAHEIVAKDLARSESPLLADPVLHTNPFSALARVRGKLFSWPQSAGQNQQREYYNAALGLFLLLDARFGEQAIRDIMQEIAMRQAVDRHDLLEITNQAIGTDVKELVADFQFPRPGLDLVRVTPAVALNEGLEVEKGLFVDAVEPNGPADRAGLQAKDVILTADSAPIAGDLDFELALFGALDRQTVSLTIWRQDEGTIAIEMPLAEPAESPRAPGKRRNPLKKGRIDFLGSFPFLP